jgi:hypothetical protein
MFIATIPGIIANKVARVSAAASPAYGACPLWLGGVSRTPAELEAAHPEGTGEIWYIIMCGREPGMYHSPSVISQYLFYPLIFDFLFQG